MKSTPLSVIAFAAKGALAGLAGLIIVASFVIVFIERPLRSDNRTTERGVQISLLHWGDDTETAIVDSLVRAFERKYPDIKVLRTNPGGSEAVATKFQTMVAAGDPPDVFYLGYEYISGWADKGLLEDLEPWIQRDQENNDPDAIALDEFYANVINTFRYDSETRHSGAGTLYGIAKDFTTVGFYYNKNLFDRAGVPYPPTDGWTWDEFIDAARKIGQLPDCYGADFPTWEAMVRVYCWTNGAYFTKDDFRTFNFDDPKLHEALEQLRTWFFEGRTLASAKTQLETGDEPFLNGRIGMAGPFGRWKVPVYRLIRDFDWDYAPLPHGEGCKPANGIFTTAWAMAADGKHKDAAWKLVRFLAGEEGQKLICEPGLAIPTMISVAESPCFVDPDIKPAHDRVYLDAVPFARPITWPPDPKYLDALRVNMERVFKSGSLTVDQALANVEREWNSFRKTERVYPLLPWKWIILALAIPLGGVLIVGGGWWWARRPSPTAFREELAGYGMLSPWLIGFFAFTAFPVVLSLILAFTQWTGLATLNYAHAVGFDNFTTLAQDATFLKSLRVTFYYALLAVPLGQLFALFAALLMNEEIRGIHFFRAAWYLPSVLAGVAIAILWRWVFHHEYGLLNAVIGPIAHLFGAEPPAWFERDADTWAVPAFVIMSLWAIGGPMMIYLAGLKGIPNELYEAASIDGARWFGRLRNVTLPMLSPVIFFNGIMAIIASFQIFTQVWVMTGGGPGNATNFYVINLYKEAFPLHEMGYASAMAWLLLLIILVLTLGVMRGTRKYVYYEALKA